MSVAHYLAAAILLPVLFGGLGYVALSRLELSGLTRLTLAPGVTVIAVGAFAAGAIPLGVSGEAASYVILAITVVGVGALAVSIMLRSRWRVARPGREELPPIAVFLACYAFLVGFNLMPSNPPGSINPCAPAAPGEVGYMPPVHPGPCAIFAPASLTMSRVPHRSIDDLLQFRTAQAAWNRQLFTEREFAGGWRLQDRTPLLGLIVAGMGAAGGVSYPATFPPQLYFPVFGEPGPLWLKRNGAPSDATITPETEPSAYVAPGYRPPLIDDWGYWFYRLLTIFLACLVILPTYELATRLGGSRVGILTAVAAGIAPAIMQNAYYTSPKYLGVYFGLAALLLTLTRRIALAGIALAAAYLCHPFSVILGVPILAYAARRSLKQTALAVALGAVVVLPWLIFSTSTSRPSGLLSHPLGCVSASTTLEACWEQFESRPQSDLLWQRLTVLPRAVLPFGLDSGLQPPGRTGLSLKWLTIHDFSFPGMVGFTFFVLCVIGLFRVWRRHRELLLWIVGGQLAFMVVFWGLPAVAAWVAGLGILPFLFYFGAEGLGSLSPRSGRWVGGLVAAEWLLYIAALYRPIEGVSFAQYAVGWLLVTGGLLFMLVAGYLALSRGWPERGLRRNKLLEGPALSHA
jgi:hypothetical protein